ncbi:hypothetical protein AVEN_243271-1 [Araneus ventricosus]|uniref:Uncharacterized protein n=1 Tax=Araneus ventricosus TaxID=182803 RepID=A0A4Y2M7Y0_ARAVE|nr:hypothetical protein AVEN_243271-1 [Araneus ventricosus]
MSGNLRPMIIRGGASYILRGFGQMVYLEAGAYSEDPDNPEDKEFKMEWSCRYVSAPDFLPEGEVYDKDISLSQQVVNQYHMKQKSTEEECFKDSKIRSRWLVVRCRPRRRRVPGSKPDSVKDPSCIGSIARKLYVRVERPHAGTVPTIHIHRLTHGPRVHRNGRALVWCISLEWGCQLRCRPRHLTAVQNDEISPHVALVLLQNGALV